MSRSVIYTENLSVQALPAGAIIDLGNIVRRYGCNLNLVGDAINLKGSGYYKVDINVTLTGTTAGTATLGLYKDGNLYTSRSVSLAAGDVVTVPIDTLIREFGCCYDNSSNLTLVLGGFAETVSYVSVVVVKE